MAKDKIPADWAAPPPIEDSKNKKINEKNFLKNLAKQQGFTFKVLPKEPLYK